MELNKMKIAILGGGNIGSSLARGLVKSKSVPAVNITITRRQVLKLSDLSELGINVSPNNIHSIAGADVVILAVLPQQLNNLLNEIGNEINDNQLVISVVSGVSISDISSRIGNDVPVVRAMPNTAIAIGESMTCIAGEEKEHFETVQQIFNTVGSTVEIHESQMTSATALCACGIAFFLRAIRAASQGGVEVDFHAEDALKMAAQTAKGAASLILANESHPEDEIDKVTSPKGCTIAGLNQMEHNGFSSAFIKGITTSAVKAGGLYEVD